MEFKKYQHIERLNTTATEGILNGTVVVMPKIDGTNGSLFLGEDGLVHAGSRKRELDRFKDNQGFYGNFHKDDRIQSYLKKYPTHRLFGEYLKPHSIRTYVEPAWDKFYVFDVCVDNGDGVKYIPYEEYKPLLEEFGIDYIPVIATLENPSFDEIAKLLNENNYLIKENCGYGEGIVIKNYDFINRFGNVVWAKLIHSEFNNGSKNRGKIKEEDKTKVEKRIARKYITNFVVEKEFSKILNEDPEIQKEKLIPKLINLVYYTLITEEMWNVVKDFKKPVIDLKALLQETREIIKEAKPELFTKQQ